MRWAAGMKNIEQEILKFLTNNPGEHMDSAIAKAIPVSMDRLQVSLGNLSARNEIVSCHSTRFVHGKKIEGTCCRLAGYTPVAKAGRKPAAPHKT
jgi:hypothetical protein